MSDTTVTTAPPLPNDQAARSPTGEILDRTADQPRDQSLTGTTTTEKPTETKPATDTTKPADAPADDKKPVDPPKAPDAYAAFKAPDNYTLDPKAVEAALPIFKELGLTQDQAQKLVDLQIARDIEIAKAPADAVETMHKEWRQKVAADPDLAKAVNGDKTGIDAVRLDIARAKTNLDPVLLKEFNEVMDSTGIGDNPAFVKAFWKLSQLITEGKHVNGGGPSPAGQTKPGATDRPSGAKAMFPNLP